MMEEDEDEEAADDWRGLTVSGGDWLTVEASGLLGGAGGGRGPPLSSLSGRLWHLRGWARGACCCGLGLAARTGGEELHRRGKRMAGSTGQWRRRAARAGG